MSEYERDNRTVGELGMEARRIRGEIERINKRNGGAINVNGAERDERENLSDKALALDVRIAEGKQRHAALLRMAGDTSRQEHVNDQFSHLAGSALIDEPRAGQPLDLRARVSGALGVVQRMHTAGELTDQAALRLDGLVRNDRQGADARYLTAVADPAYRAAFRRLIADPGAQYTLTGREREALARVGDVVQERAALGGSSGPIGGYAVPAALDPSIVWTGDSALNPLRTIAKVVTISSNVWKGVSAADVEAHYRAEGAEVEDDAPTLAQPECYPERCDSFVPFSIEVGQDWAQLESELIVGFQSAKDVVEADKFVNGRGHGFNEPEGIVEGLDPASVVETIAVGSLGVSDLYAVKAALGARFRPSAKWAGSGPILDSVRRLVGSADPDEPQIWSDGTPPQILGKGAFEATSMGSTIVAGQEILVYGDFSHFVIVDRIGMSVELVAHLFGGARHYPTGQRGLLAIWRNSSVILADEAFRLLRVKTTT